MRVVAGRLGGRRLHGVLGAATRPTTDRARAGLFDWIGPQIAGASVLDLFAGSGAVGIEALSRGAASATFVEMDRAALAALRRNLRELQLGDSARVLARDATRGLRELAKAGARFELVFADPPYALGWSSRLLSIPALAELLAPGGVLIVERGAREGAGEVAGRLSLRESRRSGEAAFDWYQDEEGRVG